MNKSTALGAEKVQEVYLISKAHEKFYYEKLQEVRYQDVYHKALVYCLGISDDTRRNVSRIYDFKTGCVKPECLKEGWHTSGSVRVVRMAFNLYCNVMVCRVLMIMRQQRSRWLSAGSIPLKNYFAAAMHHSSGRRYRSAIRSMPHIIENCTNCLEGQINVEDQIDGNEE